MIKTVICRLIDDQYTLWHWTSCFPADLHYLLALSEVSRDLYLNSFHFVFKFPAISFFSIFDNRINDYSSKLYNISNLHLNPSRVFWNVFAQTYSRVWEGCVYHKLPTLCLQRHSDHQHHSREKSCAYYTC